MIFLKELNRFPNRKITIHRFNLIAMNHNIFYILIIKFENILNRLNRLNRLHPLNRLQPLNRLHPLKRRSKYETEACFQACI